MTLAEKMDADPELAEQVAAVKRSAVVHGWIQAVGFITDGPCQYESGTPEQSGAVTVRGRLRALADRATAIGHPRSTGA